MKASHVFAMAGRNPLQARHQSALAAALLSCIAAPSFAQLTVTPNVNISKQQGNQAEGQIAINPTNPNNIFALYNNLGGGNGMWGAVSTNGGVSWTPRAIGTGADGLSASIGDPTVAYDNFGNLFLAHLTSSGILTQIGLSTTGGASFTTLTTFASSTDQPTITAWGGSAWVTFEQGGASKVSGATVSGLGSVGAWSALAIVPLSNSGITGSFGDIAIGPGGRIAVAYQNSGTTQGPDTIFMNYDPDGLGATAMGTRLTITSTNVGAFDTIPPQPNRTIDAEVGIAFDRSGGPFNGRLYCVYTDETVNENNDTDIRFRYSDNNGTTWSAPIRVNDDATTRSQFLPRIGVDPVTGHIALSWYDCRNDAANTHPRVYASASINGGVTWMANVQVSAGTSAIPSGGFDFGDYNGLAIHNDVFFPLWADNSNSTGDNPNGTGGQDMYTAKVTITVPSTCYANCDASTTPPILTANDFQCFLNAFAAGQSYANCDNSTVVPVLTANDFQCFLNAYAAGCS